MFVIALMTHALAALIGVGSVSFYMAAFFYPEVNRPRDSVWSGLGLLYALVLWLCAAQMTAAILLGQMIAGVLLMVLGYQTLSIRREKTPVYQQTPVVITPEVAGNWAKNTLNELRIAPAAPVPLKLEKRSLSEFPEERLGIPIDPRRRPAYEYEFVEDGVLSEAGDESGESPLLEEAEALPVDVTPPSAIADIISVEAPVSRDSKAPLEEPLVAEVLEPKAEEETTEIKPEEVVPAETEIVDSDLQSDVASEEVPAEEVFEEEASEEDSAAEEALLEESHNVSETKVENVEPKAVDFDVEAEDVEREKAEPVETSSADAEDDWGDRDWIEAEPLDSEPTEKVAQEASQQSLNAAPPPKLPKEKPSLLAMPIIFAGWVKDVAVSFTKPKPSKPVIEIPRREPSIPRKPNVSDAVSTQSSTAQSLATQPVEAQPPVAQPPIAQPASTASNWESDSDSNWDDESEAPEESNWDD